MTKREAMIKLLKFQRDMTNEALLELKKPRSRLSNAWYTKVMNSINDSLREVDQLPTSTQFFHTRSHANWICRNCNRSISEWRKRMECAPMFALEQHIGKYGYIAHCPRLVK